MLELSYADDDAGGDKFGIAHVIDKDGTQDYSKVPTLKVQLEL